MNRICSLARQTAQLCALTVVIGFARQAHASGGVADWTSADCGGQCDWTIDLGNQSALFWNSGAYVPLNTTDIVFYGYYDSTTPHAVFTEDYLYTGSGAQAVTSGGSDIYITAADYLLASASVNGTITGYLDSNDAVTALSFTIPLIVTFTTTPTNVLPGGCHISTTFTIKPSNTWIAGNPGYPQTGTAYGSSSGAFKALDDGETSTAGVSGCGGTYTNTLNNDLQVGSAYGGNVIGMYSTGTISYTGSTTIYPD
jgi:hypothetical protein